MTLPISFTPLLEEINESFGGATHTQSIISPNVIEKIASYPGFVYIVKPWKSTFDLVEQGYAPGSTYTIHTKDRKLIYVGRSATGLFGNSLEEKALLTEVNNGDYWYISFSTNSGYTSGIIWINNELSPYTTRTLLDEWNRKAKITNAALDQHEAFLTTNKLLSTDLVKLYFVTGTWAEQQDPSEIKSNPNTQVRIQSATGVLTVFPKKSGWYYFECFRGDDTYTLNLNNIRGASINRIRPTNVGSYFFELGHRSSTPRLVNSSLLPTIGKPKTRSLDPNYIHLEADLDIQDKDRLTGSSNCLANSNVMANTGYSSLINTSTAIALPNLGFSVSLAGIALADVSASKSDRLILVGVSTANTDISTGEYSIAITEGGSLARIYTYESINTDGTIQSSSSVEAEITLYKTLEVITTGSATTDNPAPLATKQSQSSSNADSTSIVDITTEVRTVMDSVVTGTSTISEEIGTLVDSTVTGTTTAEVNASSNAYGAATVSGDSVNTMNVLVYVTNLEDNTQYEDDFLLLQLAPALIASTYDSLYLETINSVILPDSVEEGELTSQTNTVGSSYAAINN